MIDRHCTGHLGLATVCFGGLGALIYVLMITVTLTHLEAVSGQVPFDMRPLGYSPEDAAALLEGLGVKGRHYYLTRQIPLDTVYPALLALFLVSLMRWFGHSMPAQRLVRLGFFLAVGAALCDYCENIGIAAMILNWSDLSAWLVHASSIATVAKSGLTTVAVMITILLGVIAARQRVRPAG